MTSGIKLRDVLAQEIKSGKYVSGDKVFSEREYAKQMGISRMTARDALEQLQGEGFLYKIERRGYFVSEEYLRTDPTNHKNIFKMIDDSGRKATAKTNKAKIYDVSESLSKLFACSTNKKVYNINGVSYMDDRKICYEENYLLADTFENFLNLEYYEPITDFIEDKYSISLVQTGFRAVSTQLRANVSDALGVKDGTPGLFITRLKSYNGKVIQIDREFWLSDIIEIVVGNFPE